jgi:hypothetical protein
VAPAAPRQVYAVDSQQTKLIRGLAPYFTHRLFLSATPHNGYPASFTALLEILDDRRFARGVTPDPAAVRDTMMRRLKRDIVDADGTPRFVARRSGTIPSNTRRASGRSMVCLPGSRRPDVVDDELALLERMETWALAHEAQPDANGPWPRGCSRSRRSPARGPARPRG